MEGFDNYTIYTAAPPEGHPMSFDVVARDAKAALDCYRVLHRLTESPFTPDMEQFFATSNGRVTGGNQLFCLN